MKIFLFTYIYSRYFNICLQKYMAGCLYLYMFVYSFGWSRYKSRTEGEKHLNRFKGLCFVYSCSSLWGEYGWVSKFARMASTFSLLVSWWSSVFYWLTMPKRIEVNKWEFVWRNGCRWVSESSRHSLSINNCLLLFYEALMFYVLLQPLWSRAYPIQMPESIPQLREIAHTHTPPRDVTNGLEVLSPVSGLRFDDSPKDNIDGKRFGFLHGSQNFNDGLFRGKLKF